MKRSAEEIVAEAISARKRWGRYAHPNVSMDELLDALVSMQEQGSRLVEQAESECAEKLAQAKDDLTVSNRRYAALNARYHRLAKKHGESGDDPTESGDT